MLDSEITKILVSKKKNRNDLIKRFIEIHCNFGKSYFIKKLELVKLLNNFLSTVNYEPLDTRWLSRIIKLNFNVLATKSRYIGIELNEKGYDFFKIKSTNVLKKTMVEIKKKKLNNRSDIFKDILNNTLSQLDSFVYSYNKNDRINNVRLNRLKLRIIAKYLENLIHRSFGNLNIKSKIGIVIYLTSPLIAEDIDKKLKICSEGTIRNIYNRVLKLPYEIKKQLFKYWIKDMSLNLRYLEFKKMLPIKKIDIFRQMDLIINQYNKNRTVRENRISRLKAIIILKNFEKLKIIHFNKVDDLVKIGIVIYLTSCLSQIDIEKELKVCSGQVLHYKFLELKKLPYNIKREIFKYWIKSPFSLNIKNKEFKRHYKEEMVKKQILEVYNSIKEIKIDKSLEKTRIIELEKVLEKIDKNLIILIKKILSNYISLNQEKKALPFGRLVYGALYIILYFTYQYKSRKEISSLLGGSIWQISKGYTEIINSIPKYKINMSLQRKFQKVIQKLLIQSQNIK